MLDFEREYILENDSAMLRPLRLSDYEHLLDFAIHEPEIWTHSLIQAGSAEKLRHYIEKALESRKNKNAYPFIVFDKRTNHYAGSTRFYDVQNENAALQLGYTWYGKDFQGTGLNKSCKYLLLEFAFDILQMERVEFRADNRNQRSIAAMKSIGCVAEGVLRSNVRKPEGGRRDSIVLSILKQEWDDVVREMLKMKIKT